MCSNFPGGEGVHDALMHLQFAGCEIDAVWINVSLQCVMETFAWHVLNEE